MNTNRRNVLLGLGTAALSGATVFGSGAFTSVESDRTVSVETAGDSAAYLQLKPDDFHDASTTNGSRLEIQFDSNLYDSGNGVNQNATIQSGNVSTSGDIGDGDGTFIIENASGEVNDLDITLEVDSGDVPEVTLYTYDSGSNANSVTDDTANGTVSSLDISADLSNAESIDVAVEIVTDGSTITNNPTITVIAEDAAVTA